MPEQSWLDLAAIWAPRVATFTVALAAFVTALSVIWMRTVRPAWKAMRAVHEDVRQMRLAVDEGLPEIRATLVRELTHNGGSSIKDALVRLEHRTGGIEARVGKLADQVDALEAVVISKQIEHDAIWDAIRKAS